MAYRPSAVKIVGNIIKAFLYSIIALIVIFFIWRIWFSTNIPNDVEQLVVTDSLVEAYNKSGGELYGFNQDQYTITRAENNYGYFSIEEYVIIPEARQVQIIFRYNNNTIEKIAEKYNLGEITDRTQELFEVTLVKTEDKTPDISTDNYDESQLIKTRYHASEIVEAHTLLYNYYRIVFENVDIDEDTFGLFADIYYVGAVNDYAETADGTLCLYDYQMIRDDYEFESSDIKRIKKGKNN